MKRPFGFLRLLAVMIALDLLLCAAAWIMAPAFFERWNGACASGTAFVVLFGGENSHTPARVETALGALRQCPSAVALLIGGARPERGFYGAEEMKAYLAAAGIDPSRLTSERRSFDSASNAEAILSVAAGRPIEELVLVSDTLHIARMVHATVLDQAQGSYRLSGLSHLPSTDPLAWWWRPHYELAAWILVALPDGFQSWLLERIRR